MENDKRSIMQRLVPKRKPVELPKPAKSPKRVTGTGQQHRRHHHHQEPQQEHQSEDKEGDEATPELLTQTIADVDGFMTSFRTTCQELRLGQTIRRTRFTQYPKEALERIIRNKLQEWLREGGQSKLAKRFHVDYETRQIYYESLYPLVRFK